MKIPEQLLVTSEFTILNALKALDDTAYGILLLVDQNGRLLRTITDGDIRRLLLTAKSTSDTLRSLPEATPLVLRRPFTNDEALALMNKFVINQIPVVDDNALPVEVLLRHELDSQLQVLLSTPHLSSLEREYVEEAFRTNWIAPLGPNVDAFERELANYVGAASATAVSSGTAAIHLALVLLGVQRDDIVFCSSLTFVASANPILYQGATPVFIDSEPESWNMSPLALRQALQASARTGKLPKAVITVNLYGQSADYDQILSICAEYDVPVIEDAAESLGATYKHKMSGTLGAIGIFSFNGNKIITTSGGGMLVSDNKALTERARYLATQARDPAPYYQHTTVGYNYRMSNVLAGIGRGQLRVIKDRVCSRRAVFERYSTALHTIPALVWMPEPAYGTSTHWLTACTIDPARSAVRPEQLIKRLSSLNIEARHVWKPLHLQPLFSECSYFRHRPDRSISDGIFETGVCLPSGSNMTSAQQDRIIEAIRGIFESP